MYICAQCISNHIHIVAFIGFEQESYTFREGVDSTVEVCFRIISPQPDQFDTFGTFALVNVEPFENTAQGR